MSRTTQHPTVSTGEARPRPRWLKALGDASPPDSLEIDGRPHRLVEVFKHDSWAATSLYIDEAGTRRVVKLHRKQSAFGVPLSWVGLMTARRESTMLGALSDLPGIPELSGPVAIGGAVQRNGVAREFVEGHPLGDRERVGDDFFPALDRLLKTMHGRRIVYVDLHKRENVLVDAHGRPCLFDFQIGARWPRWLPAGFVFGLLTASDDYHMRKHWARCRPDQYAADATTGTVPPPWWIRAHRLVARPIREMRRRLLVRIGVRTGRGRVESERFAEHALRSTPPSDRQAA
ncbi:hypothetical protein [Paludisphaera sp.]|uniref:hypothetical protein n=1 Tax=Paludisphaera sp. TaxID=2017432 RepID=UPI00301D0411